MADEKTTSPEPERAPPLEPMRAMMAEIIERLDRIERMLFLALNQP